MTFTISSVADALGSHLKPLLPGVTFYEDPRQQLTDLPCCFPQLMSSDINFRMGGRLLRALRFDLTYLEDFNLTDLQRRYQRVSEILDLNMEKFPYCGNGRGIHQDGDIVVIEPDAVIDRVWQEGSIVYLDSESVLLRTYNRVAQIDLDALHYKFELRVWLTPEEDAVLMQTLRQEIIVHGERG